MRSTVESGSLIDIMYSTRFNKIRINRDNLKPSTTPLIGFARKSIVPQGTIQLPMTIGELSN